MLPDGWPGSSGSGVSAGLDDVVRNATRVGKEVLSGLGHVRSRRLMPTKQSSASADLLKFDEEEEIFMVDGLEDTGRTEGATDPASLDTRREDSLATIGAVIGLRYPLTSMKDSGLTVIVPAPGATLTGNLGEERSRGEQQEVYARFDDVSKVLEKEREERRAIYGAGALPISMRAALYWSRARERGRTERRRNGKLYD
jgi:hypothetical protein